MNCGQCNMYAISAVSLNIRLVVLYHWCFGFMSSKPSSYFAQSVSFRQIWYGYSIFGVKHLGVINIAGIKKKIARICLKA